MSCSVGANSVRPLTAKVITVSDRSFRGEREDLSGPAVKNLLERAGYAVGAVEVLPDEQPRIESEMCIRDSLNNTAHNNRLNGFMDTINGETGNEIELLAFQPCFDRDDYAHEITQHALRANPDLTGIYVASNGQVGACAAVEEEGRKGKVKVVAFDLNPMNMELLQSDSLSFVLDQKAFEQGYRPPFLLFDYLQNKKAPEKELLYTDIAIKTKFNSDKPVGME